MILKYKTTALKNGSVWINSDGNFLNRATTGTKRWKKDGLFGRGSKETGLIRIKRPFWRAMQNRPQKHIKAKFREDFRNCGASV